MNKQHIKKFLDMDLHQSELVNPTTEVMRVPGGLLYTFVIQIGEAVTGAATFVPVSEKEYPNETNT